MKLHFLFAFILLTGQIATAEAANTWDEIYTASIAPQRCKKELHTKTIEMPLDHQDSSAGQFKFHYMLSKGFNRSRPTVIYLDGGPGGVISPTRNPTASFAGSSMNIVTYHIRGAGCSQLPKSTDFDRFLTVSNVLGDIEALRQRLGIPQWDLVAGGSFGAWLATKYSNLFPNSMKKVLVEGLYNPIWRTNDVSAAETLSGKGFAEIIIRLARRGDTVSQPLAARLAAARPQLIALYHATQDISRKAVLNMTLLAAIPSIAEESLKERSTIKNFPEWRKTGVEFFQAMYLALYSGVLPASPALKERQKAIVTVVANKLFPGQVDAGDLALARQNLALGFSSASSDFPTLSYRVASVLFPEVNSEESVEPLKHPTLIIAGSLDLSTHLKGAEFRVAQICKQNCLFVKVDGGGHPIGTSLPASLYPHIVRTLNAGDLSDVGRLITTATPSTIRYSIESR